MGTRDLLCTLVFGLAIPFGSLAVLVLGCGDNRRAVKGGKKKSSQVDRSVRLFKKKSRDYKKDGKTKPEAPILDTAKKGVKRTVSIKSVKPASEEVKLKKQVPQKVKSHVKSSKVPVSSAKKSSLPSPIQSSKSKEAMLQPEKSSSGEHSHSSNKSSKVLSVSANNKQQQPDKYFPAYCSENAQFDLKPDQLFFNYTGGQQSVTLSNHSKMDFYAVKVKCSDNDVYNVIPAYAIVEPGKKASFEVYRNSALAKLDKLVFLLTKVQTEKSRDYKPADAFKSTNKNTAQIVLPLVAIDEAKAEELNSRCVCLAIK